MLRRPAILFAGLLLAVALGLGLARLFELRFERGDIFPPYSTLRTDPLGASVFYESLARVPGVRTRQYFEAAFKDDNGRERTLFVLGTHPASLSSISGSEFAALQRFVIEGGRVVIAFYPLAREPRVFPSWVTNEMGKATPRGKKGQPPPDGKGERGGPERKSPEKDEGDDGEDLLKGHYTDLSTAWGFEYTYKAIGTNDEGSADFPVAELVRPDRGLPAQLPVHTSLGFTNLTNGWSVVYRREEGGPVVVERKFGPGSVVLAADSYPVSNEAMFKDRCPPLLAWLLGGGREAIFDEAHLNIVEQPGVATLMRRYRLHGLVLSLVAAAGLFVWKNGLSLVPPPPERGDGDGPTIAGRDSASGFVNLVRRSIAPAEIINVCLAEWKKSGARLAAVSPEQRRELELRAQQQAALEPRRRDPVDDYRAISRILQRPR